MPKSYPDAAGANGRGRGAPAPWANGGARLPRLPRGGAAKPGRLEPVQSNFNVKTDDDAQAVVIRVTGELDLASSPALEQELERGAAAGAQLVIVDLRQLEFMDSTGLSVLVRAHQRATENGQRFGVVKGPQQVQRLLSLTGVADRLNLADSPDELLARD
jgi:anti-anti-sigma factor